MFIDFVKLNKTIVTMSETYTYTHTMFTCNGYKPVK